MDNGEHGPGHEVFGLNAPASFRVAAPAAAHSTYAPGPVAAAPAPPYVYVQGPPPNTFAPTAAQNRTGIYLLIAALMAISMGSLYLAITGREALSKQSDEINLLTRRLDSSDQRYAQMSGEFQVTSEKLGLTEQEAARAQALAAEYQRRQQQAVSQLNAAIQQKASASDIDKLQAETSAKFGGLSDDLAGTRKDLESAKAEFSGALAGTKGELSGAIARTHDELVALAHRTDRDYFEFNVTRRNRQKVGNLTVELTKTNVTKNQFTINLYFDDKRTERKDKAIYEPVYFYMPGAPSAVELVVNQVGKDSIAGYVSTPKGFFANAPNVLSSRPGA
jgi:predicted  nucleic acid-binding Zn-ribbon protein